jgi:hypothetical protein
VALLRLSRGLFAIVDVHRFKEFNRHRWRATRSQYCWYVTRKVRENGRERIIYLHRVVAKTPPGYECHHKNRFTFDCREDNLENKLPAAHAAEHGRT